MICISALAVIHPPAGIKTLTVDPANPNHQGIAPHVPNQKKGLFTGFNTTTNKWEVWLSSGPGDANGDTRGYIQAVNGDPGVTLTNMTIFPDSVKGADLPIAPRLLMNTPSGFQDETVARGLGAPIWGSNAVAADFDNDGDQDLLVLTRGGVQNTADILFENNGAGGFQAVPGAAGAPGPIGAGTTSNTGISDSVALADFDIDGFVDIFETHGLALEPDHVGGPDKLYINTTRIAQAPIPNHWLLLDLIGKVSDPSVVLRFSWNLNGNWRE